MLFVSCCRRCWVAKMALFVDDEEMTVAVMFCVVGDDGWRGDGVVHREDGGWCCFKIKDRKE